MFTYLKRAIANKIDYLISKSSTLFEVEVDKDTFWEMYLDAYPEGTNQIYRKKRKYDCSCCRSFIKQYGTIVGIIDNEIVSIWDIDNIEEPYKIVANKLATYIKSQPIANIFKSNFSKLGTNFNFDKDTSEKWDHFYYELPKTFVVDKNSVESEQGIVRSTKEVIARSFLELTPSAIDTVLDLIQEKTLYRGEEHLPVLVEFKKLQKDWIVVKNKDLYCWEIAVKKGRFAAIRNTAIGTLLINLSEGMDIEKAVGKYESVVAPSNYKRPKAIFTGQMLKQATETVKELGLESALQRRYAKLEDISIQNVIWASGNSKKIMQSPMDVLLNDITVKPKSFEYVEETNIEDFIANILPGASSVELLVDNSYRNNFVSLIAPTQENVNRLFKWDNNFSWSYVNGVADSIKESVKAQGGKVDGVLRFSLSWAENDNKDNSDLDGHCKTPNGHIYYANKKASGGELDVDIRWPDNYNHKNIVENIVWTSTNNMPVGDYIFYVHNFACRGNQKGFIAQLEFGGTIHTFEHSVGLRDGERVDVVTVNFDGKVFKIVKSIPSTQSSKEVWGVNTMKFVPVSTIMFSPNYWDNQKGIGNKHYFFFLQDCKIDEQPRPFYNEFLRTDLLEHKKTFEALASKLIIEPDNNQLSGLGFSSTMDNSIVLRINNKPIKINFNNGKSVANSASKKVQV